MNFGKSGLEDKNTWDPTKRFVDNTLIAFVGLIVGAGMFLVSSKFREEKIRKFQKILGH